MTATTITVDELTKALTTLRIHIGRSSYGGSKHEDTATYPDALARDLFREVEKYREPLYEHNGTYIDDNGDVWRYNGTCRRWHVFGSVISREFDTPKRPLRRMVPEPARVEYKFSLA